MLRNIGINHLVALLGFVLAVCSYLALHRYGAPEKVCVGGAILCILVVSIFWSCVLLGANDEED